MRPTKFCRSVTQGRVHIQGQTRKMDGLRTQLGHWLPHGGKPKAPPVRLRAFRPQSGFYRWPVRERWPIRGSF
jgi:hypothetical protein